jgi:hypothetical protein
LAAWTLYQSWLTLIRNTLHEIKETLQQKGDTFRMSADMTESLRARNPSVRVAGSIYSQEGNPGAAPAPDAASIVAPSELEFDFDDLVVSSHVYRKIVHAQAKSQTPEIQEPALGDLIDLTDTPTPREEGLLPAVSPEMFQDLQDLTIHAPPARERTGGGSEDQRSETATAITEPDQSLARSRGFRHVDQQQPPKLAELLESPGQDYTSAEAEVFLRCAQCFSRLTGPVLCVPTARGDELFHSDCFTCTVRPIIPQLPSNAAHG